MSPLIQLAAADADQLHSEEVDTDKVPAPPPAPIGLDGGVSETWHLTGLGPVVVSDLVPQAAAKSIAHTRGSSPRWAKRAAAD